MTVFEKKVVRTTYFDLTRRQAQNKLKMSSFIILSSHKIPLTKQQTN